METSSNDTKNKLNKIYNIITIIFSIIAVALAIFDITKGLQGYLIYIDKMLLIYFTIDYFTRLFLSEDKLLFFKNNIFDLIAIIPFNAAFSVFRISRIARIARLAKLGRLTKLSKISKLSRLVSYILRLSTKIQKFINTNGFKYMLITTISIIFIGAIGIHYSESIPLIDSLWYSIVTVTTVGYGDFAPASGLGRIVACILMICGIGLIGSLTSTVSSFFIKEDLSKNNYSNLDEIKKLKELLDIEAITQEEFDIKKKELLGL